jgi:hypothetical protein
MKRISQTRLSLSSISMILQRSIDVKPRLSTTRSTRTTIKLSNNEKNTFF